LNRIISADSITSAIQEGSDQGKYLTDLAEHIFRRESTDMSGLKALLLNLLNVTYFTFQTLNLRRRCHQKFTKEWPILNGL